MGGKYDGLDVRKVLGAVLPVKEEVGQDALSFWTNTEFRFVNQEGVVVGIEEARD